MDTNYANGLITQYQYYIEGVLEKGGTTDKECVVTNRLEDTVYKNIYVKAFYPGNTTGLESNKLEVTTKEEVEEVVWTNNTGANRTIDAKTASYQNPIIPEGFSAVNTTSAKWNLQDGNQSDWNQGLVIKNATDGNEFVWVPINGSNVTYSKWCTLGESYANLADIPSPDNFDDKSFMTKSQGFWVARYESGLPEGKDQTSAEFAVSKPGMIPWNGISWDTAKKKAESMYTNSYVQSGLVNGTQWDTIMRWLQNAGINVTQSSSWGNYSDVTRKLRSNYSYALRDAGTNTAINWEKLDQKPTGVYLIKTGGSKDTRANNIYDLAGNLREWTSEMGYGGDPTRVTRGGAFDATGAGYPASVRYSWWNPGDLCASSQREGFRVVLYLKI